MAKVVIDGVEYEPKKEVIDMHTHKCPTHGAESCIGEQSWTIRGHSCNRGKNPEGHSIFWGAINE